VQLVLQAGALGRGGELFMLDMGEPVRVVDLARDMIRLSGLDEGTDIQIQFTGIRPGEKLYEEMFFSNEHAEQTAHPKVLRARNGKPTLVELGAIEQLIAAAEADADDQTLRLGLACAVPEFSTDGCGSLAELALIEESMIAAGDDTPRTSPTHTRLTSMSSRTPGAIESAPSP
jgi:FlaA1/EpsC-like NDP-sugar epimerase